MAKVNRADSLTRIITDHKQRIEKLERNFVSSGGSINIFAGYGLKQDGLELYVNTDEIATREYVDGLIEDIALSDLGISRGMATVPTLGQNVASTSVAHDLGVTPAQVLVTPRGGFACSRVDSRDSTSFLVTLFHRESGQTFGSNTDIDWIAIA